jgi:hypothetical protein
MFKQVKSALFWYYLYKFRKRVILIVLLLLIALFANAIYSDIVEYLKLKDKLEYLEIALILKWLIILFNLSFSVYLFLGIFQKKKTLDIQEETKVKTSANTKEKLTQREKEFLYKKRLKSKADILVDK